MLVKSFFTPMSQGLICLHKTVPPNKSLPSCARAALYPQSFGNCRPTYNGLFRLVYIATIIIFIAKIRKLNSPFHIPRSEIHIPKGARVFINYDRRLQTPSAFARWGSYGLGLLIDILFCFRSLSFVKSYCYERTNEMFFEIRGRSILPSHCTQTENFP